MVVELTDFHNFIFMVWLHFVNLFEHFVCFNHNSLVIIFEVEICESLGFFPFLDTCTFRHWWVWKRILSEGYCLTGWILHTILIFVSFRVKNNFFLQHLLLLLDIQKISLFCSSLFADFDIFTLFAEYCTFTFVKWDLTLMLSVMIIQLIASLYRETQLVFRSEFHVSLFGAWLLVWRRNARISMWLGRFLDFFLSRDWLVNLVVIGSRVFYHL